MESWWDHSTGQRDEVRITVKGWNRYYFPAKGGRAKVVVTHCAKDEEKGNSNGLRAMVLFLV